MTRIVNDEKKNIAYIGESVYPPVELLMKDLTRVMSHPKSRIDSFAVTFNDWCDQNYHKGYAEIIENELKQHTYSNVREVKLLQIGLHQTTRFFRFFKAGDLKRVIVEAETLEELYTSDQWKMAEYVEVGARTRDVPIKHLINISEFTVNYERLTVEQAFEIREVSFSHYN